MNKVGWMLVIGLVGCGQKAPPEPAAEGSTSEAPPAASEAAVTAPMPDSPEAKSFAKQLVKTPIANLSVARGDDSSFAFTSMAFAADGTYQAKGEIDIAGETMPCDEAGTWQIDDVTSADQATMVWTTGKTNCASRETGQQLRAVVTLGGDAPQVEWR